MLDVCIVVEIFLLCYSGRCGSSCHQNQINLRKKGYEDWLCRYIPRLTFSFLFFRFFPLFIHQRSGTGFDHWNVFWTLNPFMGWHIAYRFIPLSLLLPFLSLFPLLLFFLLPFSSWVSRIHTVSSGHPFIIPHLQVFSF